MLGTKGSALLTPAHTLRQQIELLLITALAGITGHKIKALDSFCNTTYFHEHL